MTFPCGLTASVIRTIVYLWFAVSASTFNADRDLWQSRFVWIHAREHSCQRLWGNPEPELTAENWALCQNPSFQMWECEAAAVVTSGAFCTSWPVGYFVCVWRPYISVITPVCALCWQHGFRLLMCLPKHTTESQQVTKCFWSIRASMHKKCIYVRLCVHSELQV